MHFPLGELGLGAFTLSKAQTVANLNTFKFNKEFGKILLQKTRKLPVYGKAPFSILIETNVI